MYLNARTHLLQRLHLFDLFAYHRGFPLHFLYRKMLTTCNGLSFSMVYSDFMLSLVYHCYEDIINYYFIFQMKEII